MPVGPNSKPDRLKPILQNRLDFLVNRNMCLFEPDDGVTRSGHLAEVKEAADVVILVQRAENPLNLAALQAKVRQWRQECEAAGDGQILFDDFLQGHSFNGLQRA